MQCRVSFMDSGEHSEDSIRTKDYSGEFIVECSKIVQIFDLFVDIPCAVWPGVNFDAPKFSDRLQSI